ncbi:MAG: hypothetical protein M1491_03530 [Deltaproteobacteria bacterium]|nr:hypothetical protein [Deltaproteobacteria bacterium]MCL5277552.1 hypothetical protein [Deltaproteobacteria bacterium]
MNYKKLVIIHTAIAFSIVLMLPACSKKKSEEEITITLKTEGSVPSQSVSAQPSVQARPALPVKHEAGATVGAREKRLVSRTARQPQKSARNETVKKTPMVAVNAPSPVSGPSPEDIAKQQILAIIDRQKQAMVTKNVSLALEDIVGSHDQNRQALEDYFNRYDKIDVSFSNISINVMAGTAIAVMDQRTSIVTKSVIPQTITELTRVQWTFVDVNGRWYISGTQILSKLKDK